MSDISAVWIATKASSPAPKARGYSNPVSLMPGLRMPP
jgi:hypothetical protein